MVPVFPRQPIDPGMNEATDARGRIGKEQAFYDRYGSDSIGGFYRFILLVGELWDWPGNALGALSSGKGRRYGDPRLRPR